MTFLCPKIVQRISKEIADLHKNPIDGIEVDKNIDNVSEIHATIQGPVGTPYEGGEFTIKLVFGEEFPAKPPKGYFVTRIFHPNVSREGDICVNTLKRDWKSTLGLRHVLMVIRCLMIEPNPDSALNAEAGRLIQDNYASFEAKAKMFTEIHAKSYLSTPATSLDKIAETTLSVDTEDSNTKENINSLNSAATLVDTKKKATTGLKTSALLVKKPAIAKIAAKNDAAKKKALNRL
jgi:ubiquitin-protein ligase